MKKKLLLLIPALMALSACNGAQPIENNTFLEDTEAHAELFGGEKDSGELKAKRNAIDLSGEDLPIAYQIKYTEATDKLAIRFVAAVKNLSVKAEWKRGIAGAAGGDPLQGKGFANAAQEATKYYTTLSDGNTTIEAKKGDYADYNGFVVYTLYNIPYTANANAYVAAYLNIYEDGDTSNNAQSKVFAVKIEKLDNYTSKNTFSFIHSDYASGKHFLQGTINGVANQIVQASEWESGDSFASYDNILLKATDSFGSFYYRTGVFQFFGYDAFFATNSSTYFDNSSSIPGYAKPKASFKYTLYVSRGNANQIYTSVSSNLNIDVTLNITLGAGSYENISYVGAKYRIGSSGDINQHFGNAAKVDGVWTVRANDKIVLPYDDNDFIFFIDIYSPSYGDSGNSEVTSTMTPSWTAFTVTITDRTEAVTINITTPDITTKGQYACVSKSGTNCSI